VAPQIGDDVGQIGRFRHNNGRPSAASVARDCPGDGAADFLTGPGADAGDGIRGDIRGNAGRSGRIALACIEVAPT